MTEKKTTPKKVAPKKVASKKEAPKKAVEESVEEKTTVEKKETKKVMTKQKRLDNDELIEVMNNTTGRYMYIATSGYTLELNEYGDTEFIPFSELRTMSASAKPHIQEAYIIILNEDAVNELGYSRLYEGILDADGVSHLLESRDYEKIESVLEKMPLNMKETVAVVAKRKFKTRELYDVRVRDVLEKALKIKIEI